MKTTNKEIKLLNNISVSDETIEEDIFEKQPDWDDLKNKNIITDTTCENLKKIVKYSTLDRLTHFNNNIDLTVCLINIISDSRLSNTNLQYFLTLLYVIIRGNTAFVSDINNWFKSNSDFLSIFYKILERNDIDEFTLHKAVFLLTSFASGMGEDTISNEIISQIIDKVVSDVWKLNTYSQLDALKNIAKIERYRSLVWKVPMAYTLLDKELNDVESTSLYIAIFLTWLLTFNNEILLDLNEKGLVNKLCRILRENKIEKVLRVAIHLLKNCINNCNSTEILIQQDAINILNYLEYGEWTDHDLYDEIREGISILQQKIKLLSNFEQYCRELATQKLKWSFLHSEKFWKANFMHFEENEFDALKKLSFLLISEDPVTSAVACFDFGEFARYHPVGKAVIRKIKVKEKIILLMSHKDRNVSRQALLSVQKIMLDHWESVVKDN